MPNRKKKIDVEKNRNAFDSCCHVLPTNRRVPCVRRLIEFCRQASTSSPRTPAPPVLVPKSCIEKVSIYKDIWLNTAGCCGLPDIEMILKHFEVLLLSSWFKSLLINFNFFSLLNWNWLRCRKKCSWNLLLQCRRILFLIGCTSSRQTTATMTGEK